MNNFVRSDFIRTFEKSPVTNLGSRAVKLLDYRDPYDLRISSLMNVLVGWKLGYFTHLEWYFMGLL